MGGGRVARTDFLRRRGQDPHDHRAHRHHGGGYSKRGDRGLRLHLADSTLPHLWPTGSSLGYPIDCGPVLLRRPFGFHNLRWTPCPPENRRGWLQVHLGCIQLSPSCPFRFRHTFLLLRPARLYPRFWIRRSSFERRRDFNPPEPHTAQHTRCMGRTEFLT